MQHNKQHKEVESDDGGRKYFVCDIDCIWEKLICCNAAQRNEYHEELYWWEGRLGLNPKAPILNTEKFAEAKKVFWFLAQVGKKKERRILKEMFSVEMVKDEGMMSTKVVAITRFEKGDIITCLTDEELYDHAKGDFEETLYFGGTLFRKRDAGLWQEKNSGNACYTTCGIVRATQRILPGEEIHVDYDGSHKHAVTYLGCRIVRQHHLRGAMRGSNYGTIIQIDSGEGKKEIFVVKYDFDSKVERLTRDEVEERVMSIQGKKSACAPRKKRYVDESEEMS